MATCASLRGFKQAVEDGERESLLCFVRFQASSCWFADGGDGGRGLWLVCPPESEHWTREVDCGREGKGRNFPSPVGQICAFPKRELHQNACGYCGFGVWGLWGKQSQFARVCHFLDDSAHDFRLPQHHTNTRGGKSCRQFHRHTGSLTTLARLSNPSPEHTAITAGLGGLFYGACSSVARFLARCRTPHFPHTLQGLSGMQLAVAGTIGLSSNMICPP